jgi:hypothetical protein
MVCLSAARKPDWVAAAAGVKLAAGAVGVSNAAPPFAAGCKCDGGSSGASNSGSSCSSFTGPWDAYASNKRARVRSKLVRAV